MKPETISNFIRNQNQSILNNILAINLVLTKRNCGSVEYNTHTGFHEFVTYDGNGDIIGIEKIYGGQDLNGWTI